MVVLLLPLPQTMAMVADATTALLLPVDDVVLLLRSMTACLLVVLMLFTTLVTFTIEFVERGKHLTL